MLNFGSSILSVGFSRQEYGSGLPFPSPLCQNSPPWPIHLGWPYPALAHSVFELDKAGIRWSVWLVFCDYGFHSVCPLMETDQRLTKASWWERLTVGETQSWHHRLDGRESEWTLGDGDEQRGLACCDSWGQKSRTPTEQLNWNGREGPQLHPSTENWIHYLLSMALLIKTRLCIPLSQSIPSGSFHKPLNLLCQRADNLKTTITEN